MAETEGRWVYGSAGVAARPVVVAVDDASHVGAARRAATALAADAGLDETAQGRVALAVTELATNLAKHAGGGTLIAQAPLALGTASGTALGTPDAFVEVLAVDRGPGISDVTQSMTDGYSTAGTRGAGLGAIRRAATFFDLDTRPDCGTVVLARFRGGNAERAPRAFPDGAPLGARLDVGAVCVPIRGETVSGDAWVLIDDAGGGTVVVADGLGHGANACDAAESATRGVVDAAARGESLDPPRLLERAHGALRATRGAAVAAAALLGDTLHYAGVGNVAATLVGADAISTRGLVSHNGIVGHQMRAPQALVYPYPAGALLVLATDGVKNLWRLSAYPGLARRHPSVIAATLWRDGARGRDDATVVVVRPRPTAP